MSDYRECLFHLILGLDHWEKNKIEISPSLHKGHMQLAKLLMQEGRSAPVDLPSLIRLLQSALTEWGVTDIEDFPLEASLLVPYLGLSSAARDFLMIYESPEEAQAREVLAILQYCRGTEPPLDEQYRLLRTFLISNPVVTAMKLLSFALEFQDPELVNLLNRCYEEITNDIDRYRLCPRCGWTLEYRDDGWRCGAEDVCGSLQSREELQKWTTTERILRLKPGIYRYTMLPGLSELEARNYLEKKGYHVTMFPQVDRYDLEVKLDKHSIYLDMKDFKHPISLASFFNRMLPHQLEKYRGEHIYVVIPKYRNKLYPGFAKMVNQALKPHAQHIRIIDENEVLKLLEGGGGE